MRIALFTETFQPKVDGIVTRLSHTVEQLQKLGDEVLVVSPDGGLKEYKDAKIHGVSGIPFPVYPELKVAIPRPSIRRALEKFKPDLIHVINPVLLGVGGIYYAKAMNIPLIASYHTHLPQYLRHYNVGAFEGLLWKFLKLAHNQALLNLSTSTAMVEELAKHGIEGVQLWQKAVDAHMFHPQQATHQMRSRLSGGFPDAPLLLYVGRVSAEKQIEEIKPILEAIPGSRLAIVGDGPHRQKLQKYFAGTATNFVGYLRGLELASAYASADVFVFPSSTETLGLVVLEAMAAGCPVVTARAGGIPDIVTDGVNGYLFEPKDTQGAIAATKRLLEGQTEREQIRQNARKEAERWGWPAATRQLRGFYLDILSDTLIQAA